MRRVYEAARRRASVAPLGLARIVDFTHGFAVGYLMSPLRGLGMARCAGVRSARRRFGVMGLRRAR